MVAKIATRRSLLSSIVLLLVLTLLWPSLPTQSAAVYPGASWQFKTPAEVGLNSAQLASLKAFVGGRGAVVRGGYMAYTWGDQALRADIASAAKPIYSHLLFEALEQGRLPSLDTLASTYQPCLNSLNASLGYKDRGITFRHLANQLSGYGVREAPGQAFDYNDWQMALFWDTLFLKVYGTTYGTVDSAVFRPLLTDVLQMQDSPTMMAFGTGYRQGRVGISVRDLARFGLLYLRQGNWNGTQVIPQQDAVMAVSSPLGNAIPRTTGVAAPMCAGQRSIGSTTIPDNQTDHLGSYSWLWWTNGVDRNGVRQWPDAPLDTFVARGHGAKRVLAVIPSLDIVAVWNDSVLNTTYDRTQLNRALRYLRDAATNFASPTPTATQSPGQTPTQAATATSAPTGVATNTPTSTAIASPAPTETPRPSPTAGETPTVTATPGTTSTPTPTATRTPGTTPTPTATSTPTATPVAPVVLLDEPFAGANGEVVGNGWVEVEASGARVTRSGGKLYFADTSDVVLRPMARRAFSPVTAGRVSWSFDWDWKRTGTEKIYQLAMQLGSSRAMSDAGLDAGVGVNLVWTAVGTGHEVLAFRQGGTVTPIGLMSGPARITVVADLASRTYEVSAVTAAGEIRRAGVPFDSQVDGLDTVRFLTDSLNEVYFAGRTFDNVVVQTSN